MNTIRAAAVQFQHRANNKAYNLEAIRRHVAEAQKANVNIIAFPEMCTTGYWHVPGLDRAGLEDLAEPLEGETVSALRKLALQSGMLVGAGLLGRVDEFEQA